MNILLPYRQPSTKTPPLPCCNTSSPHHAALRTSVAMVMIVPNYGPARVNHALSRVPQRSMDPLPRVVANHGFAHHREASRGADTRSCVQHGTSASHVHSICQKWLSANRGKQHRAPITALRSHAIARAVRTNGHTSTLPIKTSAGVRCRCHGIAIVAKVENEVGVAFSNADR